jgi:hypothetical protein
MRGQLVGIGTVSTPGTPEIVAERSIQVDEYRIRSVRFMCSHGLPESEDLGAADDRERILDELAAALEGRGRRPALD